ncbi:4-hydroxy-3-methylbut-2-enyl diphosphate reductase [Streptomyces sp. DT2A-34]|uniref:4-hydroxy-3-methylbut-2-enyl diphosphate reductase n=1 Tax=Streptomyces sp. DT2A-34 TaxID=3051182 RepID=UPI00265C2452|nr:4-hydroxy-3-methylbut-2-enyl diphosphate reductase [Streptomyces sp. DT2A-34]MDO0909385.1 4-hydroxy-3-methylbut-2-enyl diphosphate reductase [Streptomyces sp. DT2A-34]
MLSEVLHSATVHVTPGTLAVAESWTHPTRGPVDCPAHHLLTAHAQEAGFTAETRALGRADLGDGATTPRSTVFAVSYAKPDGGHCGLALAACAQDTAATAFARRQIESWSAVLRTRRVLYVVTEAARREEEAAQGPSTSVPPQASDSARGPWQVCGCPTGVACPAARSAARSLRKFLGRGDEVIVVGAPADGAEPGQDPAFHADGVRVATPQQAESLTVADPDRLAFVVTPGAVVSDAVAVLAVLRRRFPRLRGQHPQEWCYTMDDLHTAIGSALAQSDVLLVTGRGTSPAARAAAVLAARARVRLREVTSLERLRPDDVDAATITVLDATTDGLDCRAVGRALDGLGPTSHVRRQSCSSTLSAPPAVLADHP